ncbi:hypothetical protein N0V86_005975 [Didymella sp. IMI 355093]|nr:hypothetical protein N0V86_005975 [Didymella sp. IMI 355093]
MRRRTLSLTIPPTNTVRARFFILCSILTLVTLVYILTPRSTITTTITGNYPYVRDPTPQLYTPIPDPPSSTPPPDKLIVKVQLAGEDLNWLLKLLPEWRNQVITIPASFASLYAHKQRVDKGRIASAYLEWLITNYANLARTLVFVPPNLSQEKRDVARWRIPNKALLHSIADLQIPYVQTTGYAALHCPRADACENARLLFATPPAEYRTLEVGMRTAWEHMFNSSDVPTAVASPGGSAFVVSSTQVRARSVEEYTRIWAWLETTKMDDESAGAVVERLWHVIFGREEVWCPTEETCQCEVFGRC